MESARIAPRQAALVALFASLTALGAFIRIPLPFVPFTLQVGAVLLAGLLLGPRFGALSQVVYLVIGLMGAPVFAQGGGPGYILNPTFGFLIGFPLAAASTGLLAGDWRRSGYIRITAAMLFGVAIIYLCGISYFYWNLLFIQGKEVSFETIIKILWLIPGDLVKIIFLLIFIKILRRREIFLTS